MDFWTAFFANLPATLLALGSLVGVILSHFKIRTVADNVTIIEKATNSMKDALVKATGEAAFLEGEKSQREKPQPRNPYLGGI